MSFGKDCDLLIAQGFISSQKELEHVPRWQVENVARLARRREWIQKRLNEIQARGLTASYDASEFSALTWIINYVLGPLRFKSEISDV
jgi:hypothetical protein